MARSDLLIQLVRSGSRGDQAVFKKATEALIAEERANRHHVLADRLEENLRQNGHEKSPFPAPEQSSGLLLKLDPTRTLADLILPPVVTQACGELVEEHMRAELLRSHGLEPRHRVLLAGPPGNGKTSLAEAIAEALTVPLFVVRYEALIGSFLGETATRLQRIFDSVRTYPCVLFFDEFETLGKERGDTHETGEIKRVVSSLLLQVDALPSYVVVVAASNHPELLDRAVWRRFQLRLQLPSPTRTQLQDWIDRFERRLPGPLGHSSESISGKLEGASFAELDDFCTDIVRRYVLSREQKEIKQIVLDRLAQWQARYTASE